MKAKEELISLMENCVHGLETAPKRLFGADGRSKENKVFVMITKNSEFVIKSDDSEQFEELQKRVLLAGHRTQIEAPWEHGLYSARKCWMILMGW